MLRDVSNAQTEINVLGKSITFPLCMSPAGVQARAHPEGELATSRACSQKNIHMGVSSFANNSVEDIISAGRNVGGQINYGMQLYTMQDREAEKEIIARAEGAGCKAIFLTADSPILGLRYHEKRSNFKIFDGISFPMVENGWEDKKTQSHDERFISFNSDSHSWDEIAWLRSVTKMEIWIKGVLTAEDVEMAIESGCDGVIVSNHGGRQLDDVVPTIDALPECVKAAQGRIRVHVDGGIRSGADIFKALALGAECCWVGRPMLWGLAVSIFLLYHIGFILLTR